VSAKRPWAWPLVPFYGAALAVKEAARAASLLREKRLQWPVISVGSVSAGGAGKTPVVIALASLLSSRGWDVDVLSRGYGRSGAGVARTDATAENAALRFGDEPVLIAERSGVPVWVGTSRWAAGKAAEQEWSAEHTAEQPDRERTQGAPRSAMRAHILDDGFQHRSLARQFEMVLVTEEDLQDTLLPAGNLREALSSLRRADALIVREEEVERIGDRVLALCGHEVPLWTIRRSLRFPAPLGVFSAGLRPLAFCAVARPESFAAMLTKAGCGVIDTVVFQDHHRYGERDLAVLARMAKQLQATGLVTTEKDAVKLSAPMRSRLEAEIGPLMTVRLETSFVYESPVVRALETRLRGAQARSQQTEAHVP
jgi:tetraacyldisaccharide 4'-kinase